MNFGFNAKTIALLFVIVLVVYLLGFYGIEHLRKRQGPWAVEFVHEPGNTPAIVVSQPALHLDGVRLRFPGASVGATNLPATVRFDFPQKPVPFGKVLYEDLTFLPGVVTFNLFGHEIELLPRVLSIDRQEVPWSNGMVMALSPTNQGFAPPPAQTSGRR